MISVLFFGPVSERIGKSGLSVEYQPGMSLQHVRDALASQFPHAFEIVSFTALNGEHVRDLSQQVADKSEIAFMAKFSGG